MVGTRDETRAQCPQGNPWVPGEESGATGVPRGPRGSPLAVLRSPGRIGNVARGRAAAVGRFGGYLVGGTLGANGKEGPGPLCKGLVRDEEGLRVVAQMRAGKSVEGVRPGPSAVLTWLGWKWRRRSSIQRSLSAAERQEKQRLPPTQVTC